MSLWLILDVVQVLSWCQKLSSTSSQSWFLEISIAWKPNDHFLSFFLGCSVAYHRAHNLLGMRNVGREMVMDYGRVEQLWVRNPPKEAGGLVCTVRTVWWVNTNNPQLHHRLNSRLAALHCTLLPAWPTDALHATCSRAIWCL
jgi:hypothetical protein